MIFFTARSSFWLAIGYVTVQHFSGGPIEQPDIVKQAQTRVIEAADEFTPTNLLASTGAQKWIAEQAMEQGAKQIESLLAPRQPMPKTAKMAAQKETEFAPIPVVTKPARNNRG